MYMRQVAEYMHMYMYMHQVAKYKVMYMYAGSQVHVHVLCTCAR